LSVTMLPLCVHHHSWKSDIIAKHPFKSAAKYKFYYFSGEDTKT